MNKVVITLTNGESDYDLEFRLLDTNIAHKWTKHLNFFIQAGQPWDDAKRFYNFANSDLTEQVVYNKLYSLLMIIKNYAPEIVTKEISFPLSQDDLNYLHHIFEIYHGLYDKQNENIFYTQAPGQVQNALGDLNIWIHRYESLNQFPRFVGTWKYKPYRDEFDLDDMKLFSLKEEWGDLRLNYCEIGKTLFDFWHDQDQYIHAEAFQPHHHFCFDFTVRFLDKPDKFFNEIEQQVWDYFDQHADFFNSLGYVKHDKKLCLGGLTIGKLITTDPKTEVINQISKHQCLKNIRLE